MTGRSDGVALTPKTTAEVWRWEACQWQEYAQRLVQHDVIVEVKPSFQQPSKSFDIIEMVAPAEIKPKGFL